MDKTLLSSIDLIKPSSNGFFFKAVTNNTLLMSIFKKNHIYSVKFTRYHLLFKQKQFVKIVLKIELYVF